MKIINYLFAVLFFSLLFSSSGRVKDIAYLQGDDLFKRMEVSDSVEIKIRKNDILDISSVVPNLSYYSRLTICHGEIIIPEITEEDIITVVIW